MSFQKLVFSTLIFGLALYNCSYVNLCNKEDPFICLNSTLRSTGRDCCWITQGYCAECPPTASPSEHPTKSPTTVPPTRQFVPTQSPEIKGQPIPIGDHCYCSNVYNWEEIPEDETYSPTAAPTPGIEVHYGDCECDKDYGLVELRLRWMGNDGLTNIQFYYDSGMSQPICVFSDLTYGEEFTCNILDYAYSRFDKNTYFAIEHADDGSCEGKYHTSCSSDIVGTYSALSSGGAHCASVYCTGWKDGNPSDGNSCDDGISPCLCVNETTTTPAPVISTQPVTTLTPEHTQIGEFCYCPSNGTVIGTGDHYGDCNCDKNYGLVELRLRWLGPSDTDLDFYYKKEYNHKVCAFADLHYGQEFVCNIWDYTDANGDKFEDFDKNTYFKANRSDDACVGAYHTSCSSDIVGTYSTVYQSDSGSALCSQLFCSGWKDGNPSDGNDCDDGYSVCTCNTTSPTPRPTSNPTTRKPSRSPTPAPTTSEPTEVPSSDAPSRSPTDGPTTADPTSSQPTQSPVICSQLGLDECALYATCCQEAESCLDDCFTDDPTGSPTSGDPTAAPTTSEPTNAPTTAEPTASPSTSDPTTVNQTPGPTVQPTSPGPSVGPSAGPSAAPTRDPTTVDQTAGPTEIPTTKQPTQTTQAPTGGPTKGPTGGPTGEPTFGPTGGPNARPTDSDDDSDSEDYDNQTAGASDSGQMETGVLAGIVFGGVVAVALVMSAVYYFAVYRKAHPGDLQQEQMNQMARQAMSRVPNNSYVISSDDLPV